MQRRPTLTEGKLMILRSLRHMEPLDDNQLTEFLGELGKLTFFEVREAIAELLESGLVVELHDNDRLPRYMLTSEGRYVETEFEKTLPLHLREGIDAAVPEWRRSFRRREQIRTRVTRREEGDWLAHMSIYEDGAPTMELKLYFSDEAQANSAAAGFWQNAEKLFATVWNILDGR